MYDAPTEAEMERSFLHSAAEITPLPDLIEETPPVTQRPTCNACGEVVRTGLVIAHGTDWCTPCYDRKVFAK